MLECRTEIFFSCIESKVSNIKCFSGSVLPATVNFIWDSCISLVDSGKGSISLVLGCFVRDKTILLVSCILVLLTPKISIGLLTTFPWWW